MMNAILLANNLPDLLTSFFFVFLRVGSAIIAIPLFGETFLSIRIKLCVALSFTFIVFPLTLDMSISESDSSHVLEFMISEVFIGLLIGLSLRLQIAALQIAAAIASQAVSLSQLLGGAVVDPQAPMGLFLYFGALAILAESKIHVHFALMFFNTYEVLEPGHWESAFSYGVMKATINSTFNLGFHLAISFIAASLIYNLALGVINRAMPQLMVAFVGAPAITLAALILFAVSASILLFQWYGNFMSSMMLSLPTPI